MWNHFQNIFVEIRSCSTIQCTCTDIQSVQYLLFWPSRNFFPVEHCSLYLFFFFLFRKSISNHFTYFKSWNIESGFEHFLKSRWICTIWKFTSTTFSSEPGFSTFFAGEYWKIPCHSFNCNFQSVSESRAKRNTCKTISIQIKINCHLKSTAMYNSFEDIKVNRFPVC